MSLVPQLRSERPLLRGWCRADREPFAALNADPEVMRHFPAVLSREASEALVDRVEAHFAAHGFGLWVLEQPATGEFLGFTGLQQVSFPAPFTPAVEIGWRLPRSAWGHGYATEAARLALRHGFEILGLPEVVSFTATTNLRSAAVMCRLGMTHDPADDFDHPLLPPDHPLCPHLLYRARPTGIGSDPP